LVFGSNIFITFLLFQPGFLSLSISSIGINKKKGNLSSTFSQILKEVQSVMFIINWFWDVLSSLGKEKIKEK